MIRRILFVAGAFLTASMLIAEPVSADPIGDEYTFVAKINALRASHGAPPVAVNGQLTDAARQWAYSMAADGYISHRSDLSVGAPSTWMFLGENVGVGQDVHSLHDAFVASPTHFANLVNPRFDSVGIGIVQVGSTLWVAQEFMQSGSPIVTQPVAHNTVAQKAVAQKTLAQKTVVKKTVVTKKKTCSTKRCRRARSRYRTRA